MYFQMFRKWNSDDTLFFVYNATDKVQQYGAIESVYRTSGTKYVTAFEKQLVDAEMVKLPEVVLSVNEFYRVARLHNWQPVVL